MLLTQVACILQLPCVAPLLRVVAEPGFELGQLVLIGSRLSSDWKFWVESESLPSNSARLDGMGGEFVWRRMSMYYVLVF